MKKLIEKSGLKLKEFAELYEIPYNTVRQWYNEERNAPIYIKKMIETIIELKSKGKQIPININPKTIYAVKIKVGYNSKDIENEWREFYQEIDICIEKKNFWKNEMHCIEAEIEAYQKIW